MVNTQAQARKVARVLTACPICQQPAGTHVFALLATTIVQDSEMMRHRFELAEQQAWDDLRRLSTWDPARDNVEWFAIRCSSGGLQVIALLAPSELFSPDRLLNSYALQPSEYFRVESIAGLSWVCL
jgi:hypothetical protein